MKVLWHVTDELAVVQAEPGEKLSQLALAAVTVKKEGLLIWPRPSRRIKLQPYGDPF